MDQYIQHPLYVYSWALGDFGFLLANTTDKGKYFTGTSLKVELMSLSTRRVRVFGYLFWFTSHGGNTPQGTNYTATCLPSRKLFKLDEPDMQDTAGEAGTSSKVMYSNGPPHMAEQKQDDQPEHAYSSYVRIRDVALKTSQRR